MREIEQRRSPRNAVPEAQRQCTLKVGAAEIPAQMANESTGGFCIVVDQPPGAVLHRKAELWTVNGRIRVRVVHLSEIEGRASATASPPTEKATRFRIGLRRLGEIEMSCEECPAQSGDTPSFSGFTSFRWVAVAALAGVLCLVIGAVLWFGTHHTVHARNAEFLKPIQPNATSLGTAASPDTNTN